jgi:WD40 repeat protein
MWDYATGSPLPVLLRRSPGFITALPLPRTALSVIPYDGAFSLAWSADGQHLATAGNAVRIWHPGTGTSVRSLRDLGNGLWRSLRAEHRGLRLSSGFLSVAWSHDGQCVAAGGVGGAVRIWDAVTGRRLRTLKGHTGPVHAVAWSPDGQMLATASSDQTARIWLPTNGTLAQTLTGHTGAVRSVAWSPDGARLTTGSDDRTASIWDPQGSLVRTLVHHAGSVSAVAWSPDGQLLASGGTDTTCQVSDPDSGEKLCTLNGHSGRVLSISWSHIGDHIATSSADHTVRVWEIVRHG